MQILLIEDDPTLNENIKDALIAENFMVDVLFDGSLVERILKKKEYDCIILDINLPGRNGFELCKEFRKLYISTPIIMLTAFADIDDKITGFDSGADDYLTKPFYMKELVARIQVLIKRRRETNLGTTHIIQSIRVDDIVVNPSLKKVFRNGLEIILTPREYQILLKLMINNGEVVSKNDLVKEIWGSSLGSNTNTIEVYINFLRNKIDKPFSKNSIKTKIGYGYYIDLNDH